MRVAEVMDAAGINVDGKPIDESLVEARCVACCLRQRLDAAAVDEQDGITRYLCLNCSRPFVVVARRGTPGVNGRRLGVYVIEEADMAVHVAGVKHPWLK